MKEWFRISQERRQDRRHGQRAFMLPNKLHRLIAKSLHDRQHFTGPTKVIYPRHLKSFPLFGIEAHGFWTAKADVQPRLLVLVSYAAEMEPGEVARRNMQSTEFADDVKDFDVANIVDVGSTILIPLTSSPLK